MEKSTNEILMEYHSTLGGALSLFHLRQFPVPGPASEEAFVQTNTS